MKLVKELRPEHLVYFRPIALPKPAAPADQKRQASLDALVEAVVGYPSLGSAKQQLQALALEMKWERLLATNWNDFRVRFDGRVHCESGIASAKTAAPSRPLIMRRTGEARWLLQKLKAEHSPPPQVRRKKAKPSQKCSQLVGTSKRCCYLCDVYLDMKYDGIVVSGTSGRVVPWAPPPCEFDREVLANLWRHIHQSLQEVFEELGIRGSGTMSGLHPEQSFQAAAESGGGGGDQLYEPW